MNKTEIRGHLLKLYEQRLRASGDNVTPFNAGALDMLKQILVDLGYEPQVKLIDKQWQTEQAAVSEKEAVA